MSDLTPLKDAGMAIDDLPPEQQAAISRLDQSEIDTLASIRKKLNEDAEVSGYAMTARGDGGFVW
jgi:hypothetical protein